MASEDSFIWDNRFWDFGVSNTVLRHRYAQLYSHLMKYLKPAEKTQRT